MSDKFILNMVGEPCPIPVVKARRALENNETISVIVDNIVSVQNLKKMADGLKYKYEYTERSKDRFEVVIGGGKSSIGDAVISDAATEGIVHRNTDNSKTSVSSKTINSEYVKKLHISERSSDFVVVIGSDRMGVGATISGVNASDSGYEDNKLGKILIKGYIFSLTELNPLPSIVIFLNSGAYLTAEGSNTVDDLNILENKGVRILTCGTCSNYYELSDKLAVGEIVDMYEISRHMANASKVINI